MSSFSQHQHHKRQQPQQPPSPGASFTSSSSYDGNNGSNGMGLAAPHNASTNISTGGGGSFYYSAEGGPTSSASALEDLDPSLMDGYRVIYDREVPIEVRLAAAAGGGGGDGDDAYDDGGNGSGGGGGVRSTLESIKCKLLILGEPEQFTSLRLELSSEADLFFHYIHALDEADYADLQRSQRLMVDFAHLPAVMTRMLNLCIADPSTHLAIFTQDPASGHHYSQEGSARLEFIQNMEYKYVELLSCPCVRLPEELVQRHITYRYNAVKLRLAQTTGRLADLTNLVKLKNPSLLLHLNKTSSSSSSGGGGGGMMISGSSTGGTTPATPFTSSSSSSTSASLLASHRGGHQHHHPHHGIAGGVGDSSFTHSSSAGLSPALSSPSPSSSSNRQMMRGAGAAAFYR